MNKKIFTLTIVHQYPRVLLGMKKKGFGEGRWNGFGGKVERGESIEEAARRELQEEAGVGIDFLEKMGIADFSFESSREVLETHFFRAEKFSGKIQETKEMKPQWFHFEKIPYEAMWPDDIFWLPMFLEGKKFKGKFRFDRPSNAEYTSVIIEKELHEVRNL